MGHAPTSDGAIVLDHPRYGDAVVLIDTRISDPDRGRMSALEIRGEELASIYTDDRGGGRVLETLAEDALRGGAPTLPASGWARARRWLGELFVPKAGD